MTGGGTKAGFAVRRLSKTSSCAPHRYVADTAAVIVNVVLYTLVARRPVVVLYY